MIGNLNIISKYLLNTNGPKYLRIDKSNGGSPLKEEINFDDGFREICEGSKNFNYFNWRNFRGGNQNKRNIKKTEL